jgi:hypothetical protein
MPRTGRIRSCKGIAGLRTSVSSCRIARTPNYCTQPLREGTFVLRDALNAWKRYGGLAWLLMGVAAFSGVMLNEVGRLLGDVQVPGRPAFDAGAFTRPHLPNRTDLQEAELVWSRSEEQLRDEPCAAAAPSGGRRPAILYTHATIDFVLFTPAYSFCFAYSCSN